MVLLAFGLIAAAGYFGAKEVSDRCQKIMDERDERIEKARANWSPEVEKFLDDTHDRIINECCDETGTPKSAGHVALGVALALRGAYEGTKMNNKK